MFRSALIFWQNKEAGFLSEQDDGYVFQYKEEYIVDVSAPSISLTLPKQNDPFKSKTMFPFFDGLIPEGWLLDIASQVWKLDARDRMGLLLTCCKDCIGAVSAIPMKDGDDE